MPTTSAPIRRRKRYSARVSRFGPVTATVTPRWATKFSWRAISRPLSISSGSYGRRHVGEPRAEPVVVDAHQRVVAHQVDLVVDDHDVAGAVHRVQAADGLRDDQQLRAEPLHHADRQRDLLERVAFVLMEAAFHRPRPARLPAGRTPAGRDGWWRSTWGSVGMFRSRAWRRCRSSRPARPGRCRE